MTERRGGDRGTGATPPHASSREAGRPERCAWCRRTLPEPAATGRPRTYCRRSCRQRAFEARRRLVELSWGEDRLRELTGRMDAVAVLVAGLDDVVQELRREEVDRDVRGRGGAPVDDEALERMEALVEDLRHAVDPG